MARRSVMSLHPCFNLGGWRFDLVLHGGRVQLEGHREGETISCWLAPTDSPSEAVDHLLRAPSCCLV